MPTPSTEKIERIAAYCDSIDTSEELNLNYEPFNLRDIFESNFSLDVEDWEEEEEEDNVETLREIKLIFEAQARYLQSIANLI